MGPGPGALAMMPKKQGFSMLVRQGTPYSRGEVRLRSADPAAPPIIDSRYFSDPRDLPVLAEGVRRARAIAAQPEIARFVTKEIQPGPVADDPEALVADIRKKANNVFHPVGTCRLGTDVDAVVDTELRVRGVECLRVADASVLPMLGTSGTYALALMVGERAAAFLKGETAVTATK
jgi:choline dehydrogenase